MSAPQGILVRQLTRAQDKNTFSNGHNLIVQCEGEQTLFPTAVNVICLNILLMLTGTGFCCLVVQYTMCSNDITTCRGLFLRMAMH